MEMRGLMGGFYKISEWIMRLAVTNVLWIVCSLPFVYLLVSAVFFSPNTDQMLWGLTISLVTAPFFFFPATAALFTVARKWVMGEGDVPLLKTFFRGYKENYVQSMLGGIIYALLFIIMIVDFRVYLNGLSSLQLLSYIFIGLMVLLFVSLFNFFSMTVHYHMKTLQLVKNAILITIGRPIRSVGTVITCGFIIYISTRWTFLIPFFMGSLVAMVAFYNFYGIYQKLQLQAEKAAAAQEADETRPEEADLLTETKEEAVLNEQNRNDSEKHAK
jgi:uncharacterized membrane protein YesL